MSDIIKVDFYKPVKEKYLGLGFTEADFNREVSFAIQHIHKQPLLKKCTPESILKSVTNLAQVSLTLNPISKYAYLIPRWNNGTKQYECVLEPDYRGLQKLLTDSGAVKSIDCQIIWEGDFIDVDMASIEKIREHRPYFLNGNIKGKILGAYSLAVLADNTRHCEIMSYADIVEIKERSDSYKAYLDKKIKTCIWVSDEPEMCRKTVIKRHYKYLPKSSALDRFERAVELDNEANGFNDEISFGLVSYIDSLIYNSVLMPEEKNKLMERLHNTQKTSEGLKLVEELEPHQPVYGRDKFPTNNEQIGEAAKYAADKDDFYERNTTKRPD